MSLRKMTPYLVVIQLVLLVLLLFQVNTVSNALDSVSGFAAAADDNSGAAAVVDNSEPVEIDITGDPYRGGDPEEAKVLIVEFSDFECPFCSRAAPTVEALLDKYGDDISVVYKDFPLSFHANAMPAAVAAECADEQGMFWEYHDLLFETGALDSASLLEHAETIGLDVDEFTACVDSGDMTEEIEQDMADGAAAGARGTPAFFVNGVLISGAQPQTVFEAEIDQYL